jgi:hypothetical protein
MIGLLTVVLILSIVSITSLNFEKSTNQKNAVDDKPVLFTPIKPNTTEPPKKPQVSTVESISHDPNIKVYDKNSNQELTRINWGSIAIGQAKYYDIKVTNEGDQPVTLRLSAINWTPGVDASIEWQYNGTALATGSTIAITLYLTVQSASTNTFDNDIVISATNA